jgi:hypothetical protein
LGVQLRCYQRHFRFPLDRMKSPFVKQWLKMALSSNSGLTGRIARPAESEIKL